MAVGIDKNSPPVPPSTGAAGTRVESASMGRARGTRRTAVGIVVGVAASSIAHRLDHVRAPRS